jgi:hypothetical protein
VIEGLLLQAVAHGSVEDAGGDSHHPNFVFSEVSGEGEDHAIDGSFCGSINDLSSLPLDSGDAADHDDDAPFSLNLRLLGHCFGCVFGDVEGADDVDLQQSLHHLG